ncbi:hypothetical protein F385_3797 [Pantoea agglomerans 299R]|nr:hypothetical protein F385_3797 [Pantoea agglomerans 299R]
MFSGLSISGVRKRLKYTMDIYTVLVTGFVNIVLQFLP